MLYYVFHRLSSCFTAGGKAGGGKTGKSKEKVRKSTGLKGRKRAGTHEWHAPRYEKRQERHETGKENALPDQLFDRPATRRTTNLTGAGTFDASNGGFCQKMHGLAIPKSGILGCFFCDQAKRKITALKTGRKERVDCQTGRFLAEGWVFDFKAPSDQDMG